MKSYNLPLTSLFLVLMSACTLNTDVANNISNESDNSAGTSGVGGSSENGGAGGSSNGGGGAGGSPSVSVDGGVEMGAGDDIGVGGTVSFADAGNGDAGNHVVVLCDSPNPVPGDVRNWFTLNNNVDEWFQLITTDGFSVDRCTYTGKVKWFYQGPDGFWESNREYDSPETIITLPFEQNGDTKVNLISRPSGIFVNPYPDFGGSNIEYQTCLLPTILSFAHVCHDAPYLRQVCFYPMMPDCRGYLRYSAFRGEWQVSRPVIVQTVYPNWT